MSKRILQVTLLACVLGLGLYVGGRFIAPPAASPAPPAKPGPEADGPPSVFPPIGTPVATATQPGPKPPHVPPQPASDQEMVSISFRDVPVEQLFAFISEKTGKPVIPQDNVKQKRITVVGTRQLPLAQAMAIIHEALEQNGIVIEESPTVINMKTLADANRSTLRVIPADQSVAAIADKAQVVHKIIELKYFDVLKMKDIVLPMLPAFGHVMADPNTHRLMVTDTVGDLERIEQVIANLDVSQADQTMKKIIPVKQGDAAEIVTTIRALIGSSPGVTARDISSAAGAGAPSPMPGAGDPSDSAGPGSPRPGRGSPGGSSGRGAGATAVFVEADKTPVVLLADSSHNWIVAVAPARIMALIEEWVVKLDVPAARQEALFDMVEVKFADVDDMTKRINQTLDALLPADARQSVRVVSYVQSRKVMISGSRRGRELVRGLIAQIDQEAGNQSMRIFPLAHADAEEVAKDIEQLYGSGKQDSGYNPWYYDYSPGSRQGQASQRIKVTADTRRNALIVISDDAMLDQIGKLLKEQWDLPLATAQNVPKIYTLKYADPVKLKDMLEDLFGQKEARRSPSPYFYDSLLEMAASGKPSPVSRLNGQFKFQAMPDSNRLLVASKNAANLAVVDKIVEQLDQPDDAGMPQMVELKHANAEDLAEQLNASLAEPGTLAEILRAKRDLGNVTRQTGLPPSPRTADSSTPQNPNNQQRDDTAGAGVMPFWWARATHRTDERPTSNLIGKIRFVPITRRNALLIVAPRAYADPLRELIQELDQPGTQVMIHVVIADVQHNDAATLGIRLASNPSVFNDPRLMDTAIAGSAGFNVSDLYMGNLLIGNSTASQTTFNGTLNFNFLLQLLIRDYGLKILYEPRLYTADNQEAEFFDGQDVPIQTNSQTSAEGTSVVSSYNYTAVGTRLRIRPHITKERDVDLTINLELSDIAQGQTQLGNLLFDRRETTTHVIMHNGQTIMLSGIVQQQDFKDIRKFPLLGDLPLLGPLFRSNDVSKQSRELVAFITPHVVERGEAPPAAGYKEWFEKLRKQLGMRGPPTPGAATQPEDHP